MVLGGYCKEEPVVPPPEENPIPWLLVEFTQLQETVTREPTKTDGGVQEIEPDGGGGYAPCE